MMGTAFGMSYVSTDVVAVTAGDNTGDYSSGGPALVTGVSPEIHR